MPDRHRGETKANDSGQLCFGDFEIDLDGRELRRSGLRVPLRPQSFRLLALLLSRAGRLVSREEIRRELWGEHAFVDFDQSTHACIREIRRALGDSARGPCFIETRARLGYRFLAPVEVVRPARHALRFHRLALLAVVLLIGAVSLIVEIEIPIRATAARAEQRQQAERLWLLGHGLSLHRTPRNLKNALAAFRRAAQIDPHFAQARASLAEIYLMLPTYTGLPRRQAWIAARSFAEAAACLDSNLARPHAVLAVIAGELDGDESSAKRDFALAARLDPSDAIVRQWHAEYEMDQGNLQQALAEIQAALQIDPVSPVLRTTLGSILISSRRTDEAIRELRRTLNGDPLFASAHIALGRALVQSGRVQEALEEFDRAADLGEMRVETIPGYGYALAKSGRRDEACRLVHRFWLDGLNAPFRDLVVVETLLGLGDIDWVFDYVDRESPRDLDLPGYSVNPLFDGLRRDPRSRALRALGPGPLPSASQARPVQLTSEDTLECSWPFQAGA